MDKLLAKSYRRDLTLLTDDWATVRTLQNLLKGNQQGSKFLSEWRDELESDMLMLISEADDAQ